MAGFEHIDQGPQTAGHRSALRVAEIESRIARAPPLKHGNEPAIGDVLSHVRFRGDCDADGVERGLYCELPIIHDDRAVWPDTKPALPLCKLPIVGRLLTWPSP